MPRPAVRSYRGPATASAVTSVLEPLDAVVAGFQRPTARISILWGDPVGGSGGVRRSQAKGSTSIMAFDLLVKYWNWICAHYDLRRMVGGGRSASTAAQSTSSELQCRVIQIVRAAPERCQVIECRSAK